VKGHLTGIFVQVKKLPGQGFNVEEETIFQEQKVYEKARREKMPILGENMTHGRGGKA